MFDHASAHPCYRLHRAMGRVQQLVRPALGDPEDSIEGLVLMRKTQTVCGSCGGSGNVVTYKRHTVNGKTTTAAVMARCKACGGRGWR